MKAQTLANTYMALEHDLELVPILNKIDLPSAHPDEVAQEVEDVIDQPETVSRIWQLIIGDPGNYLKYYIGYLEFLELKKNYMAENPDTFSQKSFHKSVLDVGPAPFAVVEKYMKE